MKKNMISLVKPTPSGLQPFPFCNQTKNNNKFSNLSRFLYIKGQAANIPQDDSKSNHALQSSSSFNFQFKDYIRDKTNSVNKALEDTFSRMEPSKLVESMSYSVLGGGKRLRSVLCIAGFELFGGHESIIMPCACAVEMIHSSSFIHDDLPCMDNSDLRRWKSTHHKAFGENIAVLAGDALISLAFELITSTVDNGVSQVKVLKALKELAICSGAKGLIAGQVADVSFGSDIGLEQIEFINIHKSAVMIEASVVMGAIFGGANDYQISKLRKYARCIGLSGQIVDDILDVTKSSEELGKTAGSDLVNDKMTYPRIMGIEKSREFVEKLNQQAQDLLDEFDAHKISPLICMADYLTHRDY